MGDPRDILSLPDELLIKILEFCDLKSLEILELTCEKFKFLINTVESVFTSKSSFTLCSNMKSEQMKERSKPHLSSRMRCEVARKWREGLSNKRTIIRYRRCMPWIFLEKDYLYCNKEGCIIQFDRDKFGNTNPSRIINYLTPHGGDISKFIVNGKEIITGARDGLLARWSKSDMRCIFVTDAHVKGIRCVDAKENIIISGSCDSYVKVWKAYLDQTDLQKEVLMGVRVLSVSILPSCRYFIVGLPGTENRHPLQLFNFEKEYPVTYLGTTYQKGAGILDIYPECDSTFYCTGYDTTVKLWDIRSPEKFVSSWMDPYDNGQYCVMSDHNVTIISGANRSGLVHVWDKRKPGEQSIQIFDNHNSPAYSATFDASHLFVAYDQFVVQHSFL